MLPSLDDHAHNYNIFAVNCLMACNNANCVHSCMHASIHGHQYGRENEDI